LENQNRVTYDSAKQGPHALSELQDLFRYRFLLEQLIKRDLTTRYKRSVLGIAWTMLNPLGTMLILSFVFSNIFKATHSYPVYILTGLTIWNLFSQASMATTSGLVWGGTLLKQIYLPRTVFGVSAVGTGIVNVLLSLIPLILVMLITQTPIRITILFIPIPIIIAAMFTLGVGLLVSGLAIYFPDVADMYNILLQAWFYLTPIIYTEEIIPKQFAGLFFANPMYWIVRLFRLPTYFGVWPQWADIWPALISGLSALIIGWFLFTARSDEYSYRV